MDSLYDSLLQLQTIPGAYIEWSDFREALTDFIIHHSKARSTAVIIGAGACNDFDLQRLLNHFSHITLLDRNAEAMRYGLTKQSIRASNISAKQTDLLGIPDRAYREACEQLIAEIQRQSISGVKEPEAFEHLFLSCILRAFGERKPDNLIQGGLVADCVICSGVHSQMLSIFAQMACVYRRYIAFDIDRIFREISSLNRAVATELNDLLLKMARSALILGLEESRIGIPGGIEGAAQALDDIRMRRLSIEQKTVLEWPFDSSQGKIYATRLLIIDPTGKGIPTTQQAEL